MMGESARSWFLARALSGILLLSFVVAPGIAWAETAPAGKQAPPAPPAIEKPDVYPGTEGAGSPGDVSASADVAASGYGGSFTARPQTGYVNDDDEDSYYFYMNAGQSVDLQLQWSSVYVDLDLYLYNGDDAVGSSTSGSSTSERVIHTATRTGWYRVQVDAYDGSSSYTLNWLTAPVSADDDIPGVPAAYNEFTGSFDPFDGIDVYRITAQANQRVQVWLTGPTGTDFDLELHRPGGVTAHFAASRIAESGSSGSQEGMDVVAPVSGTYYVVVRAWSPVSVATNYNLGYQINGTTRSRLFISAQSVLPYGSWAPVSGTARTLKGDPLAGRWVQLVAGSSTVVNSAQVDANGEFTFWQKPASTTGYFAQLAGAPDLVGSVSNWISVAPQVYLSKPAMRTTVLKNRYYTCSGYLKPRHGSGTYPVRLRTYRYQGGQWVLKKTFRAKVTNYKTYSKYSRAITFGTAGRWRVVAFAPADSRHAATETGARSVTVNKTTLSSYGGGTYVYGRSARIYGTLRGPSGNPLSGKRVYFEQSWDGTNYSHVKTLTSNSKGLVSTYARPNTTRYYRFRYAGSTSYAPRTSPRATVKLKPRVVSGTTGSKGTSSRWVPLPGGSCRSIIEGYAGTTDYNFYLYDSQNNLVSWMRTTGNTTWYFDVPKSGKYNLRINAYAGTPYRLTFQ